MATTLERPPDAPPPAFDITGQELSRRRRWTNKAATGGIIVSFLVAAVPLLFVIGGVINKGREVIGVDWFTKDIPANVASSTIENKINQRFGNTDDQSAPAAEAPSPGMKPAIIGTLIITGMAALMAIPLGLLGAIYLNEYGKNKRLAVIIRFFTDVMTGVPSVIMGIFIYTIWVLHFKGSGRSGFAGALALGCLMLPVVVRSAEEMLRLVPNHLREASAALGCRTWKTTLKVVMPAALPGVTSGCMLAVARAAGETAPLLFTIGSVTAVNASLRGQNTALSTQIYANATQPGGESMAWGAALTLIAIVLSLTVLARFVAGRLSLR